MTPLTIISCDWLPYCKNRLYRRYYLLTSWWCVVQCRSGLCGQIKSQGIWMWVFHLPWCTSSFPKLLGHRRGCYLLLLDHTTYFQLTIMWHVCFEDKCAIVVKCCLAKFDKYLIYLICSKGKNSFYSPLNPCLTLLLYIMVYSLQQNVLRQCSTFLTNTTI